MSTKNQRFCCYRPVNTGVETSFDSGEGCDLDDVWEVDGDITGGGNQPWVPNDENIPQIWMPNSASDCSNWITPDCNITGTGMDDLEDTERIYSVEWDIPADPKGMVLCVRFAVDNLLLRVELNGVVVIPFGCTTASFIVDPPGDCKDKLPGFQQFHVFELRHRGGSTDSGEVDTSQLTQPRWGLFGQKFVAIGENTKFVCGINRLDFVTQNHKGTCQSQFQSGFRAEFFCRCGCPCETQHPPCVGLTNTGVVCLESDVVGTAISPTPPHVPIGTGTCCIDGAWEGEANFFSDESTNVTWVGPTSLLGGPSDWLTPECDEVALAPEREYEYSTEFEVFRDPTTIKILIYWAADNQLISMVLNGTNIGEDWLPEPCGTSTSPIGEFGCLSFWCPVVILGIDGVLKEGLNTFVVTIKNLQGRCADPFQAGFRLEWICIETDLTGTGTSTARF